jgi:hypothetical protein
MKLTVDLSGVRMEARQQFLKDMHREDKARYALGLIEQLKLKQRADELAKAKYQGEFRAVAVLSEDQWKRAMDRYGTMCLSDPDFMPWLLKREEGQDMRVRDPGSKIQVGWRATLNPQPVGKRG